MSVEARQMVRVIDEEAVLRMLIESTAAVTGKKFFYTLVECMSKALGAEGAWCNVLNREKRTLKALAFLWKGEWFEDYEYDFKDSICEEVVMKDALVHYPDNIHDIYPASEALRSFKAVSFLGTPLKDTDGTTLGYLSILDTRPIPDDPQLIGIFNIFAD
ncbi:MAG: hypothetical protein L0213_04560, partial [Candidatus Dadabacteria bacterium]|nr:hypothetical protein [Candidatus Dadabacteria bacterium]